MTVPLDWLRASVPGRGRFHQALYVNFSRSLLRAAVDLLLLVAVLEALRLYCFWSLHRGKFMELAPATMAEQTLSAWPEDLVAQLSRPTPNAVPELSVLSGRSLAPLPLHLRLPPWVGGASNLALSYLLHSAVLLPFLPQQPSVIITSESALGKLPKDVDGTDLHIVLTESRVYLASRDLLSADAADELIPSFPYHLVEAMAAVVCERSEATEPSSAPPRHVDGYRCSKRHLARLMTALTDNGSAGAILHARVHPPGAAHGATH